MADDQLDLREQLVRIDRAIAETQKLTVEAGKLRSEEKKLDRERLTIAIASTATLMGASALFGGLVVRLLTGH